MKKALVMVLVLLLLCPLWGCRGDNPADISSEESKPLSYAYTVCVTINPKLTLFMDAADRVVDVRADNADAEADFADVTLTGKSLTEALDAIVDTAAEKGRLKDGGKVEVTVDAAHAPETNTASVLAAAEQAIKDHLTEKKLTAEVVVSVAAQPDGAADASDGVTSASATEMAEPTETAVPSQTTGTKVPVQTAAPTTEKPASATAATKKPVTTDDLNGTFAYGTVNGEGDAESGHYYTFVFDTENNTFLYSHVFGSSIEKFVEWGMYKTVEEALADKNATWNEIDGKYYGIQAGENVNTKIKTLTMDSVSVIDDTGADMGTVFFAYDEKADSLTCTDCTIEGLESLKGMVLTRKK